ncbi:MAG TPA: hypothetical protein PKC13_06855 [Blastocatellia bacterium]|nr:hypothetical protein [Blastocatellia bacterium]HMV84897.1 hypothetical protein [Blastocatellia bacterium]HMX25334.1 hypothetical protein [Blastocatellia bacterium]
MTIQHDPVIDEIREVRRRISERFDHDPEKLVAYYIEMQKQHESRLMPPPKRMHFEENELSPAETEAELVDA